METGVVIIQEPVFTKANVEEATAGVILDHLSMEVVDKANLSTVLDDEITSLGCRNDIIPREAEVVNGSGHKETEETEREKGEAMKTISVVEDSKIVKEKASETEKEKEDGIIQKSEEVNVEKPVIEEDQTETKHLPEQEEEKGEISKVLIDTKQVKFDEDDIEKSLNSAREEIPMKSNEVKEEDSRSFETSVNGTESDQNETVSVEEISRNGDKIVKETDPENQTVTDGEPLHDVETTKTVLLEAGKDAEPSLDAKEKDETENVKTVIEEPEIVKNEETTVHESETLKDNAEPVEAIKTSISKDVETALCSPEIKDESHGREESVEVKSKETVQDENIQEKHENLLDVPSTESVKYQDNEHETALVSDTEIREKFEEVPSDLASKVDKEEMKDDKIEVVKIDGTQTVEEQRSLESNEPGAEQIDRNRTDETEESPVGQVADKIKKSVEISEQEQGIFAETEKIGDEKVEEAEPIGVMSQKGLEIGETTLPLEASKSDETESSYLVSEFEEQKPKEVREILETEEVQETPRVIEIPKIQGEDIESKASKGIEEHEHVVVRDIPQVETFVTEGEPVDTSTVQESAILKDLETEEDTEKSLDLKEDKEQDGTETVKKTVISSDEVRSIDVQAEEFSAHTKPCSSEMKGGKEESVEVESKETVQEESTEKYEKLLNVPSGESEEYQDNKPETDLEKFKEIPSDLVLKVDKDPEAEKIDRNRTDETEEKLVTLSDVESVEQMQKPSFESPSEVLEETSKTVDEKIKENPEEEIVLHQDGQEEGSNGLETKEETVSVPESIELGEKSRNVVDLTPLQDKSCLPNEQEKETQLQKEHMEKHEPTYEKVIEVSSASASKELEGETVVEAEKIENIRENEEEQGADEIKKSLETIEIAEPRSSLRSSSEEQEHETVSKKIEDEKVEEEEPKVQIKSEDNAAESRETGETTVVQEEKTRDIEPSLAEKCSLDQGQPEEQVKEACSKDVQETENIVNETATNGESLHDIESTKRVIEVAKEEEEEEIKTDAEPGTAETVVEDIPIVEKIEEKPKEEIVPHQDGQEEGSTGLETKEETVSVPESIELGEKAQEERNFADVTPLQDELCETKLQKEHIEKHEPTNDQVIEVSSASTPKELEGETVVEAEKIENIRENEEEQKAEKIQKFLETVEITEPHSSLPSSSEEQEHETVSKKIEDEKVEEEEPTVQILSEEDAAESHETGEKTVIQAEQTRDIEPSLTEKCSLDEFESTTRVIEVAKEEEMKTDAESGTAKTVVEDTPIVKNEETTVYESESLKENAEPVVEAIKSSDDAEQIFREVTVDRVKEEDITQKTEEVQESPTVSETPTIQGENNEPKASKDTEEHEHMLVRDMPQTEAETVDTSTVQEAAVLKTLETAINESEAVDSTIGEEEEESQETKEETEPSLDLKEDKEQDETETVKTVVLSDEVVQESATVVEMPKVQGEEIESKASLEFKEEVDQSSKDTEEDKHMLGRDIPQDETLVTETLDTTIVQESATLKTLETKEDTEPILNPKEDKEQEETETVKTIISSDEVRPSDQVDVQAEESGEHCGLEIKDESQGSEESSEVKTKEIVQDESTEEKHENLLGEISGETEKFEDNEPEIALVAKTESRDGFEDISRDLLLKVDKEERSVEKNKNLLDEKTKVDQVDGTQGVVEQRGLDSNEQIDRNRTDETEEHSFEKLVAVRGDETTHDQALLDVEPVEKTETPSLESPYEESDEISKPTDEKIEEKPEQVTQHQEEGSHGLETKETVSEPESSELGVKFEEEESRLPNEEEQVADKIKKSPETVETVDTVFVKLNEDDIEESLNTTREEIQIKSNDKENVPINEVNEVNGTEAEQNVTVPVEEISRNIVNETAPEAEPVEGIRNFDDAEKISHEVTGDRQKEEDLTQKTQEVQETPKVIETPKIQGEDIESKYSKDTEEHEHVVVRDMPQVETLVTEPESADYSTVQESVILKTKVDGTEAVNSAINGEDEVQETKEDTEPSLDLKAEEIETVKTDISSDEVRSIDVKAEEFSEHTEPCSLEIKDESQGREESVEVKTTETIQEESSEKNRNLLDDKTKSDQDDETQTMEEQRGLDSNEPEAEQIDQNRTEETEESPIVEAEETTHDQALLDVESVEKIQKLSLESPSEVSEETSETVDEKIEDKPKQEELTLHQESRKEGSFGLEPVEKQDACDAPKLEESKEDKSQEVSETIKAIEATGDRTLAIETSEADQTPSFVLELEDKIPKQIEEIHEEETKDAHKLQVVVVDQSLPEEHGTAAEAEKIEEEKVKETEPMGDTREKDLEISETKDLSLPQEPSRSDGTESSVLVSELEEQKPKQEELSKAVETKETTVAQEEETRDIGTSLTEKRSMDQTQPEEQVNEECSRYEHVDSSEKNENEITLIAETKKEEFENLEAPKIEESKEDKIQEVSETIETIEATGDHALAIDHSTSFVSELEDKIPKQIEEIHEEKETKEAHKLQEEEEIQVPRESFSEAPVSMLTSREDDQVNVQEGDTQESVGETKSKESEAERREKSDEQVETSTKVINVEDEDTKPKDTETEVAEHGDESSSTLPVVEILKGLQTTLENERSINDSGSTEENTITEPAEQVQKTGNVEVESSGNDLHSIKAEQEILGKNLVTDQTEAVTNEKHDKKAADEPLASNIIEENKLQQDESGETETIQEENGVTGKSLPIEELDLKEEVKIQDSISREFEVNVEEKSQKEEIREIAESEPHQDVNASVAEKISLQEEDFETSKKEDKEETVKEEDQVVDIKEEKKIEEVKEINKVAKSEKQITVPSSDAEKESNEPQAPKDQREEVIADKSLTEKALGDEFQERRNAEAISDRDLSVEMPSELIQSHQPPSPPLEEKVDNAESEVKKAQEEKNEETVDTLITKEEAGLVEEKKEVDYVKAELEDAIKHGVSLEEKNNASEKIDHEATKEIYQEESKQTTTVKEEIREEEKEATTQVCFNSDDAAEKTQSVTREIESLSSLRNTQDKSEQKDEVPKLENPKIAEESKDLFSEVKESEPTVKEPARKSLSDLIQNVKGTNKNEDTKPHHIEEEHPKTEEEEDEDEDGEEHKDDKTSPDSSMVMVEAKDTVQVIKTHHKKSQGILSGVGSKVKHSISKVKKALTGKSSHTTKPSSPK